MNNQGVPRSAGHGGTGPDLDNSGYPYVGNGFTASRDGRLTPEWRMHSATPMQPDVTVINFKNTDGSPRTVSLGGAGSSDRWVLRQGDPNIPDDVVWEPLP